MMRYMIYRCNELAHTHPVQTMDEIETSANEAIERRERSVCSSRGQYLENPIVVMDKRPSVDLKVTPPRPIRRGDYQP